MSSDDSDFPSLCNIKSSKAMQKKIEGLIANLDSSHIPQGNEHTHKLKSKNGRPVEVLVISHLAA